MKSVVLDVVRLRRHLDSEMEWDWIEKHDTDECEAFHGYCNSVIERNIVEGLTHNRRWTRVQID